MAMYQRDNRYELLRRKVGTTADDDWAAVQFTTASGGIGGSADLAAVLAISEVVPDLGHGVAVFIEVTVAWVDTTPAPDVYDLTDRGTFSIKCVKLMQYKPAADAAAPDTAGDVVTFAVDSVAIDNWPAFRPVIIDEVWPGDRWTAHLANLVPSSDAEDAMVFYRYMGG